MKKGFYVVVMGFLLAATLVGCGSAPEPFGAWEGDVYTNEALELSITKPKGWRKESAEELREYLGIDIHEEGFELQKGRKIPIMFMQNERQDTVVDVMIEKISDDRAAMPSAEEYIGIEGKYAKAIGHVVGDVSPETLGGHEYATIVISEDKVDYTLHRKHYVRMVGLYAYTVSIRTVANPDETFEDSMTCFSEAQ